MTETLQKQKREIDISHREADIQVNHLKALYLQTRSEGIPTKEEILKRQITDVFWLGILVGRRKRELINMSLRGKTGSSKSTVGCKILYTLTMDMLAQNEIKQMTEDELQHYLFTRISSDQTEFLRFAMKDPGNTVALIDEFSTMGDAGFNSTTEQAMYTEHSDLFAQERIHKISCSPSHIQDKNADIILDVLGMDKETQVTQVIVGYRDTADWMIYPLGVANIYVGDVMQMPFYKWYREKKFKRLDLLKKHGIKNVRELEFSQVTILTYEKLKNLARIKKMTNENILSMVDAARRESKMQYSIPTYNLVVMRVKSMLDLLTEIEILKKKRDRALKKGLTAEMELYQEGITEYQKALLFIKKEEEERIEIERKYREIT